MGLSSRDNSQHQQRIWPRNSWWTYSACRSEAAKEMRALKMEEHSGRPSEIDNQLGASSKLILLQHEKLPNDSILTILPSFGIWSKLERWKSSISGYLWADHKSKIIVLKYHLLILHNNNETFLDGIMKSDEKVDFFFSHTNVYFPLLKALTSETYYRFDI